MIFPSPTTGPSLLSQKYNIKRRLLDAFALTRCVSTGTGDLSKELVSHPQE